MSSARALALAGLAFLGLLVGREAIVRASLPLHPDQALLVWSGHPDAVIAAGMAAIGEAARVHRIVDERLTGPVIRAARSAPLRIEPFLVAGVKAQTLGNEVAAGKLFQAAEERDPRAVAPHLFLSAHYNNIGQPDRSLTEFGRLIHLVPGAAAQLATKIAASIQLAGGLTGIRALVVQNNALRDDVMRALSADARNLEFVLSLRTPTSTTDWQPIMVQSLLSAGRFEPAFRLWAAANKSDTNPSRRPLVFDPAFRLGLGRPFGWSLPTGAEAGLVDSAEPGGLHISFYGRDPFTAATQTLLLPPGSYTLNQKAQEIGGNVALLSWQVNCLGSERKIAMIAFAGGGARGRFDVPSGCPAQLLKLVATSADVPETLDAKLGPIALRRGS